MKHPKLFLVFFMILLSTVAVFAQIPPDCRTNCRWELGKIEAVEPLVAYGKPIIQLNISACMGRMVEGGEGKEFDLPLWTVDIDSGKVTNYGRFKGFWTRPDTTSPLINYTEIFSNSNDGSSWELFRGELIGAYTPPPRVDRKKIEAKVDADPYWNGVREEEKRDGIFLPHRYLPEKPVPAKLLWLGGYDNTLFHMNKAMGCVWGNLVFEPNG